MSKELVISSNSHETRVAIIEDDQLVEIYFQRANEYSLAGSIHKGRVTRVLPGMQSAFVDLGLERDTFLYVSDFLDEHGEEYDQVGPDEKPAIRRESVRPEPVRIPTPPASVQVLSLPATQPVESIVAAAEPVEGIGTEESKSAEEAEKRGRRSRRRRTRGRGFPDAKYASDVTRDVRPVASEPFPEERNTPAEVMLLPGESLAKYTNRPPGEPSVASWTLPEPEEAADLETAEEFEVAVEGEEELAEEELAEDEYSVPEVTIEGELASLIAEGTVADLMSGVIETEELPDGIGVLRVSIEAEADFYFAAEDEETAAIEEQVDAAEARLGAASDPGGEEDDDVGEEEEEEEESGDPEAARQEVAEMLLSGEQTFSTSANYAPSPADTDDIGAAPEEGDATVAAENPTESESASASVREGGGRYPHRQSRRMRRRRGGERPERGEVRPEPAAALPVVVEIETIREVARPVLRSERAEKVERPERTDRPVLPSISDLLREGQEIIVQIAKEPLGQKGARITSHIALPGRFVVYMPTLEHLGVSRKISTEEERLRLKRILQASRTGLTGGFIVRTAGEGRTEEEIAADMAYLYNLWLDIRQKAEKRKAPALLHHDLDIVHRILRDQLSDMFKAIWLDNEEVYESVLRFMQRFQPALVTRVKMYTRPAGIFDSFGVTAEIEKALRPKVWLKSGGYIVINQTEALVAIDVNTGKFVGKSNRLEDTITKTNTEAVKEIVRQIRLRDLGGIIVIDFIDMDERKNRQKVMQTLEEAMRADRAPYKILQFNDFGLVAITRKRVKQSLERTLCSPCPTCEGAGYTKSVATVVGEILQEAGKIRSNIVGKNVELRVYPEVAKHLKSNRNSDLEEIEAIIGCPVLIVSDTTLHPEKFDMAW